MKKKYEFISNLGLIFMGLFLVCFILYYYRQYVWAAVSACIFAIMLFCWGQADRQEDLECMYIKKNLDSSYKKYFRKSYREKENYNLISFFISDLKILWICDIHAIFHMVLIAAAGMLGIINLENIQMLLYWGIIPVVPRIFVEIIYSFIIDKIKAERNRSIYVWKPFAYEMCSDMLVQRIDRTIADKNQYFISRQSYAQGYTPEKYRMRGWDFKRIKKRLDTYLIQNGYQLNTQYYFFKEGDVWTYIKREKRKIKIFQIICVEILMESHINQLESIFEELIEGECGSISPKIQIYLSYLIYVSRNSSKFKHIMRREVSCREERYMMPAGFNQETEILYFPRMKSLTGRYKYKKMKQELKKVFMISRK